MRNAQNEMYNRICVCMYCCTVYAHVMPAQKISWSRVCRTRARVLFIFLVLLFGIMCRGRAHLSLGKDYEISKDIIQFNFDISPVFFPSRHFQLFFTRMNWGNGLTRSRWKTICYHCKSLTCARPNKCSNGRIKNERVWFAGRNKKKKIL